MHFEQNALFVTINTHDGKYEVHPRYPQAMRNVAIDYSQWEDITRR